MVRFEKIIKRQKLTIFAKPSILDFVCVCVCVCVFVCVYVCVWGGWGLDTPLALTLLCILKNKFTICRRKHTKQLMVSSNRTLFYIQNNTLSTEAATRSILWKRCPYEFRKIYRKTPVPKSFFNKVAGIKMVRHTLKILQQMPQDF